MGSDQVLHFEEQFSGVARSRAIQRSLILRLEEELIDFWTSEASEQFLLVRFDLRESELFEMRSPRLRKEFKIRLNTRIF